VILAGTIGTDPQAILAQVGTACGYIELYAPPAATTPGRPDTQQAITTEYVRRGAIPAV